MKWPKRLRLSSSPAAVSAVETVDDVRRHLEHFVRTRQGVEAYVEPVTQDSPVTVILIAHDGEWTRRRPGHPKTLDGIKRMGVPVFNVRQTGYPQRWRDYNNRQRKLTERQFVNLDNEFARLADKQNPATS